MFLHIFYMHKFFAFSCPLFDSVKIDFIERYQLLADIVASLMKPVNIYCFSSIFPDIFASYRRPGTKIINLAIAGTSGPRLLFSFIIQESVQFKCNH